MILNLFTILSQDFKHSSQTTFLWFLFLFENYEIIEEIMKFDTLI